MPRSTNDGSPYQQDHERLGITGISVVKKSTTAKRTAPAPRRPDPVELKAKVERLEAELKSERRRTREMELELARAQTGGEIKMDSLAQLLLQALADDREAIRFVNPALEHIVNADTARCWLHDPNCGRAPEMDEFGERMQLCSTCDAFKRCAPDPYTRVGELVNAILFLLDRRQEQFRSAQEQLVQSEKLAGLGELAAGLAHEINTPTGIILARLEVMAMDGEAPIPDQIKEDLSVIRSHAERLRRITSSLTSFARRHKIEKRSVMLQELLYELLEITERLVQKSMVAVATRLPDEPMQVFGDGTLLQQVFMNLSSMRATQCPTGETSTSPAGSRTANACSNSAIPAPAWMKPL
jgi:C4-dicarboxylate-specific signal transduction histidine kinase